MARETTSFDAILTRFRPVFNVRSLANFALLVTGWLLAEVRGLPSEALSARRTPTPKHFSSYYRFFGRARWDEDALGTMLLQELLAFVPPQAGVTVVVDDTLAKKTGRHIWGANVHHDPLAFAQPKGFAFGHVWVVVALLIQVPGKKRPVAVPIYSRLYRSKKKRRGKNGKGRTERKVVGAASEAEYRTRPQLAVELLEVLHEALGERPVRVLGDSTYGGKSVARHLPDGFTLISRMTMKAALFAPPPAQRARTGRPRKKGEPVPGPAAMARDKTPWQEATLVLYGRPVKVHYKTKTALWYHTAGPTLVRVVVVRDPHRRRAKHQCFYATDAALTAEQVIEAYAPRWNLEVAFREAKQLLGFERPQSRTQPAVERTAPFVFVVYTLTVLWFAEAGHRRWKTHCPTRPWYRAKREPSFADMLETLRAHVRHQELLRDPFVQHVPQNLRKPLEQWLARAA